MRRLLVVLPAVLLLAACGEDTGTVIPTPLMTPTPASQAVIIYVLTPRQVPGYTRTSVTTLNPGAVADLKNDPSLATRLRADGFVHGADASYAPPPNVADPAFNVIDSTALLFNDARGAEAYFNEENARIDGVPPGGSTDPIPGLPRQNVDEMVALVSSQPPVNGAAIDRAFITLMRTGAVVVELFARGGSTAATGVSSFRPLVVDEQQLLGRSPNG